MRSQIEISSIGIMIPEGITAVIGSGGKTSFLRYLAQVLPGPVILATSTHMRPFEELPLILTREGDSEEDILARVQKSLAGNRLLCIGTPMYNKDGTVITKLSGPAIPFKSLLPYARFILVEADGSRNRPLKAHRPFEPVIPGDTGLTVCIIGASGLGRPIQDSVHCPDIFCRLTGADPEGCADPRTVAAALNKENLADHYVINQADAASDPEELQLLRSLIRKPVSILSLKELSVQSIEKR